MKPVFIGGTGRSGTTLLKKILARHPRVAAIEQELRVHIDPDGALDLIDGITRKWTPQNADIAVTRFKKLVRQTARSTIAGRAMDRLAVKCNLSPSRYGGWKLENYFGRDRLEDALARLLTDLQISTERGFWAGSPAYRLAPEIHHLPAPSIDMAKQAVRDFFSTIYAKASDSQTQCWVEDTPYNILAAERLLELFSDAQFVHIHRDPMDVVASFKAQRWGGQDALEIAKELEFTLNKISEIRANLGPDTIIDISLPALATSPDDEMSRVLSYVGLENDEAFDRALSEVSASRVSAGRWRNDLSSDEAEKCLQVLAKTREALGYCDQP